MTPRRSPSAFAALSRHRQPARRRRARSRCPRSPGIRCRSMLYGLGEPIWLYRAATSERYQHRMLEERRHAARSASRHALGVLERQLEALVVETPCGAWIRRKQLPDYAGIYARLVQTRDQAARPGRDPRRRGEPARGGHRRAHGRHAARVPDDGQRTAAVSLRTRAGVPQLPGPEPGRGVLARIQRALIVPRDAPAPAVHRGRRAGDARRCDATRSRRSSRASRPSSGAGPSTPRCIGRCSTSWRSGATSSPGAATATVRPRRSSTCFPISSRSSSASSRRRADVGEVVGDMKLLLEQTEDTVSFAENTRGFEHWLDA